MNDLLFAQEIAAVLTGSESYADLSALFTVNEGHQIYAAQSAANDQRPILIINGQFEFFGLGRMGVLTLEIRSRVGDETSGQHQERVDAVYTALQGAIGSSETDTRDNRQTALASLKTALSDRENVVLLSMGHGPETALNSDIDGEDLRTELKLACAWKFASV